MLQFYQINYAVIDKQAPRAFCFTTAQHLGQYLESRGVVFKGNGVNDLSKHYGQHIITRLLHGLDASMGGVAGYSFEDFPKVISTQNMGDGYQLVQSLFKRGAIHNTHIKPFELNGVQLLGLDVFSYNVVEALLQSYGLSVMNRDYIFSQIDVGPVYMEFNRRSGVSVPGKGKKPLWANCNNTVTPIPDQPNESEPTNFSDNVLITSEGGCVPNSTDSSVFIPDRYPFYHRDETISTNHTTPYEEEESTPYAPPSKDDKLSIIKNAINQIEGELDLIKSLIDDFIS